MLWVPRQTLLAHPSLQLQRSTLLLLHSNQQLMQNPMQIMILLRILTIRNRRGMNLQALLFSNKSQMLERLVRIPSPLVLDL